MPDYLDFGYECSTKGCQGTTTVSPPAAEAPGSMGGDNGGG
jgi:hypothetical protein